MIDINWAYFSAKTSEDNPVFVDFPHEPEAPAATWGLPKRHMYGTRRAPEGWQDEYSLALRRVSFRQGSASACIFRHEERRIAASVHGDDVTASGLKSSLDGYVTEMQKHFELTIGVRLCP